MLIKSLFTEQKKYIDYFFSHLDLFKAEEILSLLDKNTNSVFFSGVGKSGAIAKKLSATFLSIGIKAFFLEPLDALHGDLGAISSGDMFIALSKSGETKELLSLIPFVKDKKAITIAWVCEKNSSLAKNSDESIYLPLERELCLFGLVPTTSAAIQLIFGDLLAVALMNKKKISLEDYAKNHPSGAIGVKTCYKVEDLMLKSPNLPICFGKNLLKEILVDFSEKKCGCTVVVDDNHTVQGIFTDGDLRRALLSSSPSLLEERMENLMTKNFIFTNRHEKIQSALELMQKDQKKWVSALPVLEKNNLVGLLRMHDIISCRN